MLSEMQHQVERPGAARVLGPEPLPVLLYRVDIYLVVIRCNQSVHGRTSTPVNVIDNQAFHAFTSNPVNVMDNQAFHGLTSNPVNVIDNQAFHGLTSNPV